MKNVIDDFIADKQVAIAGVSRNKAKWGNALMKELTKKGYTVYPVNPHAEEVEGRKCYPNLKSLPADVKSLIIATKPKVTEELLKESKDSGITRVWMQKGGGKGSATPEAIEYCKTNGIDYVYGLCPMMYYGGGMHGFHLWMRRTFGKIPRELNV